VRGGGDGIRVLPVHTRKRIDGRIDLEQLTGCSNTNTHTHTSVNQSVHLDPHINPTPSTPKHIPRHNTHLIQLPQSLGVEVQCPAILGGPDRKERVPRFLQPRRRRHAAVGGGGHGVVLRGVACAYVLVRCTYISRAVVVRWWCGGSIAVNASCNPTLASRTCCCCCCCCRVVNNMRMMRVVGLWGSSPHTAAPALPPMRPRPVSVYTGCVCVCVRASGQQPAADANV
jgi:hypothetical protein